MILNNGGVKLMNILMIVTWYSPYNAELSKGIFHYEQSIALQKYCSTALYYPYDLEYNFKKDNEKGLLVYRRKYIKNRILNCMQCVKDFKQINREFKPDIIHAHVAGGAGIIATILGKLYRIPVVVTEHSPIELSRFDNLIIKTAIKWVYHNSRANICVSEDFRNRISEIYPKEKFQVIYNGIMNPNDIKRDGVQYAKTGFVNCSIVASFYDKEIKGYQYLLPAIKELVENEYNIMLHICGGGEYMDYYCHMAEELGIINNCIFYGQCQREKVYSILEQMDFSISSSILECSGVSVQEAMLLGKPLVVTKSGGADSLVNQDTAIVVERNSVEALIEGISEMIRNLSMFDERKIKEYAFHNFEMDAISRQYMDVYGRVID